MNKDDSNNSNLFKIIVIALLIVIIVLLLLNSCGVIGITNREELTGDFDIYEITLKGTCDCPKCEECKTCDNNSSNSSNNSNTNKDDNNDNKEEDTNTDYEPNLDEDRVVVYDTDAEWDENNYVSNIFKHSYKEIVSGKIAPGSNNTYKFIVRNLNEFKVKYTINFIEVNVSNINMKYRLRLGNNYIVGSSSHWVDASSLNREFKSLNAKSMDTYYLDWKWFDDDINDTPIGIDESSKYSLDIKVNAEEE